jgi:cyclase
MTMNQKLSHCFTILTLLLVTSLQAATPEEVKITELAPGVYFRKAQTAPTFTGCNQGWVVFRDYVLVIDANFPGQAAEVIPLIRSYTDKPIRFVFDTHYHGDHADGNMQYAKVGATVVAHERSQALFQTKGIEGFERAKVSADRQAEYGKLSYDRYTFPTNWFSMMVTSESSCSTSATDIRPATRLPGCPSTRFCSLAMRA